MSMTTTERDLMRLLHGALPAERASAVRAALERDPALRAEYERLRRVWDGLAAPPEEPSPAWFASRVMARLRREREEPAGLGLAMAPAWAKLAAALALVAGLALGSGLALDRPEPAPSTSAGWSAIDTTLAESYARVLGADAGAPLDAPEESTP